MNIHMDIHIWVPRDPWGGSMDTLGGPMGPWDRWDLGTDGTWASRTPDTSSELFYRYPAPLKARRTSWSSARIRAPPRGSGLV